MPEPSFRVSVVISTLDRPVLLARCLDALASGAVLPAEVVVVDQGDHVAVASVLDEVRPRLAVVHVRDDGRGLSRSQNLGVRAASGDVVAIVDDDCVPDASWVEVIESAFASGTVDLVSGRILPLPPAGDRTEAVSSRLATERREHRRPALPWEVGSGGSFAVWRDRYLAVGGNDERLGTGAPGRAGNDMDLFHRLLRAGAVARYEPALVVQHERSTVAERRSRRGSYGFGVGACVGRWWRDGDRSAPRILVAWFALRARQLGRNRRWPALVDEARIFAGTLSGLLYGLRQRDSWPTT